MAKVLSINISSEKGIPKKQIQTGDFIVSHGLDGDAHAGNWHRQVSLLANESIEKMKKMGLDSLDYGIFAENITTEGIELCTLPIGTRLMISGVILEITQIGKECHSRCKIYDIAGTCVMPQEGVFARVITGGRIYTGDQIEILAQ
jgi:MOSC domain-containing protein YiiM